MNSLYRYLTKITGFLGLWIMIFPGLGLDCDSASAKSAANINSEQTVYGGGKIIMLKIATESPNKRIPLPGKMPCSCSLHPPKSQLEHSGSKRVKQCTAKTRLPNINHLMSLFP